MNSSVKFFEPIVIVGFDALAAFLVMTPALAAVVLDELVELELEPHAAIATAAISAASADRVMRCLIRWILLGGRWLGEGEPGAPGGGAGGRTSCRPASGRPE